MTDSLGQSQVLSYLKRLYDQDVEIDLLSFEKPERYNSEEKSKVIDIIGGRGIHWHPLSYTKSPPIFSTVKDIFAGWKKIKELYDSKDFDIVHCRGYIAAILGLKCKKKFGSKFIFDMRGWWPDEKLESGLWDQFFFKPVYNYFKKLEKEFFTQSDITISLTYAGQREIISQGLKSPDKIGVIPTCVDFDVFKAYNKEVRKEVGDELDIPEDAFTLLYSGALGTNYNNEGIFQVFKTVIAKQHNAYFIILTKDDVAYVNQELEKYKVPTENVRVLSCSFQDVYKYLMLGDVGIILYKKQFSAIGRSPTKLGEYWACGLPMLSVKGLGDLDEIIDKYPDGGVLLNELESNEIEMAIEHLKKLSLQKDLLRAHAQEYFSIDNGVKKYRKLYSDLCE